MSNLLAAFPLASDENRLIAEFMRKQYHPQLEATSSINDLYYHSSWSWLMPVVERISQIKVEWADGEISEISDTYYPRTFGMLSPEGKPMVRLNVNQLFVADTLKEATYLAVVDFITWYKEQKEI